MRFFLLFFILLPFLLLSYCATQINQAEESGRAWCNERIEYINNQSGAIAYESSIEIMPIEKRPKYMSKPATFELRDDGTFQCAFLVATGGFPVFHQYNSEKGVWEALD